jgi:transcriptional regulator with GAF, ATPase, and Fis domain
VAESKDDTIEEELRADAAARERELLVIGQSQLRAHPLPARGELTMGRSRKAGVCIDDPLISRVHARLHIGADLRIEDLGSANGVRVRDRRLGRGETAAVALGEPIYVGRTVLIVQARAAGRPPHPLWATGRAPAPRSEAMLHLERLIDSIAPGTINVLVLGETGVGKELVAERVHRRSPRAGKPFLRLSCAAFSESLLESELFGYERGAFTGAVQSKPGLLETAHGGTIFLDEVGELPKAVQAKLLRVIETREVLSVGGLRARAIDVRFVAATNRDLESLVARGEFRQDLYFRLSGVTIVVPPLRARANEIVPLAAGFAAEACRQLGRARVPEIAHDAQAALLAHPWPGNIRELRHAIERAVLLCHGETITPEHLPLERMARTGPVPVAAITGDTSTRLTAYDGEPAAGARGREPAADRARILEALAACGGNQSRAAKLLGLSRRAFVARLDAYAIPRPRKDRPPA